MTAEQGPGEYEAAWHSYRQWSRAFWLLFVLFLPSMALLGRALPPDGATTNAIAFVAIAWIVAAGVVGYRKWNFRCPRCGELFFHIFDDRPWRKSWRHNPFAQHCLHCGLPKWAANPGA